MAPREQVYNSVKGGHILNRKGCFPWGKAILDSGSGRVVACLPLLDHCLDVAMTFRELSSLPSFKRSLESSAGAALSDVHFDRLAVLAMLHDAGKANLGFQDKIFDPKASKASHIRELAPLFFEPALIGDAARAMAIASMEDWFESLDSLSSFLIAAWSHHGKPVRFDDAEVTGTYHLAKTKWWVSDGVRDPMAAIAALAEAAREAFPAAFSGSATPLPDKPPLQHRFAGILMLADWLGSHEGFFPILRRTTDPVQFAKLSAQRAVSTVGLYPAAFQEELAARHASFSERFGFEPRPLQALLTTLGSDVPSTRLLIAEAETGSGKTEAALARFWTLFSTGAVDSLYFALPTRVAARELYARVCEYVNRAFPEDRVRPRPLLAVPGYARVDGVPLESILPADEARWQDEEVLRLRERVWAAERPKRFLAATIAVGTIDQALLSAVQSTHAHLRSICLDRSLLVVDEVHASDTYMRHLLCALIRHHVGAGGHALLLSATLGASARARLISAVGPPIEMTAFEDSCAYPFPSLTDRTGNCSPILPSTSDTEKTVTIDVAPWLMKPEMSLPSLSEAVEKGARVLVVLNTVRRAVALQRAVESIRGFPSDAFFRCEGTICPHHGRFSPSDREVLDHAVTRSFGKRSPPGPMLLIGTQTLEQSLDIDADFLVTDLCPADVLLQRIGRLHRHTRQRPPGFETARCLVLAPEDHDLETLLDKQGRAVRDAKAAGLGSVYEDLRTLHLTLAALADIPAFRIPADNRHLVESATHPDRLATLSGGRWALHQQSVEGAALAQDIAASLAAVCYDKPFGEFSFSTNLQERARTRLGLDSLRLPLSETLPGPFGLPVSEILIPGHMVPHETSEETAEVLSSEGGLLTLRYVGMEYTYSRFGLEKADEPTR